MSCGSFIFISCFSSRRRHTRCLSDWSSDVCSSDLCLPEKNWLSLLVENYSSPEIWGCSGRVVPHRSESAADLFEEVAGQDLGENRRVFKPAEVRFSLGLILQNIGKVFAKH